MLVSVLELSTYLTILQILTVVYNFRFGPTVAVLQSEVKKGQGGTAQGLFTLTGAIGNLAPSLLGILYSSQMAVTGNEVTANSDVLSTLLGVGVCGGYLSSAIFFSLCAMSSKPESYNSVKST
jgi:hypothetical protein